jgi:hypothetical protein
VGVSELRRLRGCGSETPEPVPSGPSATGGLEEGGVLGVRRGAATETDARFLGLRGWAVGGRGDAKIDEPPFGKELGVYGVYGVQGVQGSATSARRAGSRRARCSRLARLKRARTSRRFKRSASLKLAHFEAKNVSGRQRRLVDQRQISTLRIDHAGEFVFIVKGSAVAIDDSSDCPRCRLSSRWTRYPTESSCT